MNAGMKALLIENLKKLKLSTMIRNLQSLVRQAKQDKLSYEEFLLNLSEAEVQVRQAIAVLDEAETVRNAYGPVLATLAHGLGHMADDRSCE